MKFGLSDTVIESIQKVFEANSKVDAVIVFGSRAKGNFKEGSDIDLAMKGQDLNFDDLLNLNNKLESLNLANKIDLVNYHSIKEPALAQHIDRVGIVFYSRWTKYKFSDFALVNPPVKLKKGEMHSFVEMKDLSDGQKFCEPHQERETSGGARFQNGDTLFARITPCLENGKICQVRNLKNDIGFGSTEFHVFRGKENVSDTDFIFYLSRWDEVRNFAEMNFDGTSGRQRVPKEAFDNLFLNLPPLTEQKAIAEVLNSLDDKIDLLHQNNLSLENLAEAFFRKWFVEETEESWEKDVLGNLFDIGIGRTPPRKEHQWFTENSNDVKWISIRDMGNGGVYIDTVSEYLTREAVEKFNVPVIPNNTVLLSFKLTVGRIAITTEEMLSNEAIAHFKLKPKTKLYPEFLYLFLKAFQYATLGSTSSIAEAVNSTTIKEMEIIVPDEKRLLDFRILIEPYFEKIKSNTAQLKTLQKTRDNLLPKLMSGEVRIEN